MLWFASGEYQVAYIDDGSTKGDVLWIREPTLNSRKLIEITDIALISCHSIDFTSARLAVLLQLPSLTTRRDGS